MNSGVEKHTVLVVEDEPLIRMLAVDYLEHAGFAVFEADCGADALRTLCEHQEIEVLFSDVNMPGMDGMELARRARSFMPRMKVVLTSGRDLAAAIPGDGAFLPKPYFESEVTRVVQAALGC